VIFPFSGVLGFTDLPAGLLAGRFRPLPFPPFSSSAAEPLPAKGGSCCQQTRSSCQPHTPLWKTQIVHLPAPPRFTVGEQNYRHDMHCCQALSCPASRRGKIDITSHMTSPAIFSSLSLPCGTSSGNAGDPGPLADPSPLAFTFFPSSSASVLASNPSSAATSAPSGALPTPASSLTACGFSSFVELGPKGAAAASSFTSAAVMQNT